MMRHSKVILGRCGDGGATLLQISTALAPHGYTEGFFHLEGTVARLVGAGWLAWHNASFRPRIALRDRVYHLTLKGVRALNDPNTLAKN